MQWAPSSSGIRLYTISRGTGMAHKYARSLARSHTRTRANRALGVKLLTWRLLLLSGSHVSSRRIAAAAAII